jgi:hypothetical protein
MDDGCRTLLQEVVMGLSRPHLIVLGGLLGVIQPSPAVVLQADDCNANGVEDALDLEGGGLDFVLPPQVEGYVYAATDLGGDGRVDLVVGVLSRFGTEHAFRVLRNDGQGGFVSTGRYDLDKDASSHALPADVDGDGAADLVFNYQFWGIERRSELAIFLNDGRGEFREAGRYPLTGDPGFGAMVVTDLNDDGAADLAITSGSTGGPGSVDVLLNQGAGAFRAARSYIVASGAPGPLITADLDADGDFDLATGNPWLDEVSILLNQGDGAFPPVTRIPVGDGPKSLLAVDVNGDGMIDLTTGNNVSGDVSVLLSHGDGSFPRRDSYRVGERPIFLLATDLDGDDAIDLVAAGGEGSHQGNIAVLPGRGDGTFQEAIEYAAPDETTAVHEVDLNSDGLPDLVAGGGYGGITMFLNAGAGVLRRGENYFTGERAGFLPLELNGDGHTDLIVGSVGISFLFNRGDGSFEGVAGYEVGTGLVTLRALDWNGDARTDLATLSRAGEVSLLFGEGDGTFQGAVHHRVGDDPLTMVIADLDGDARNDLATGNFKSRDIAVVRNGGGGAFLETASHGVGSEPLSLVTGDLDGDGDLELIAGTAAAGRVAVLPNLGAGAYGDFQGYHAGGLPDALAVADFDGDGQLDLATANKSEDSVSVLLNKGDGTLGDPAVYPVGDLPLSLLAADLNGDGAPDLVATVFLAGNLALLFNQGDGRFAGARQQVVGPRPQGLLQADLDGNGDADLAARSVHSFGSEVKVFLNQGRGTFHIRSFTTSDSFHEPPSLEDSLTAGDLDGNGWTDLVAGGLIIRNQGGGSFTSQPILFTPALAFLVADLDGEGAAELAYMEDLSPLGYIGVVRNRTRVPHSLDLNRNGLPDECERSPFHRGDANGDGRNDLSDAIAILDFLFLGGDPTSCRESADVNNDAAINIADPVSLLSFLFLGSVPPDVPGPVSVPCGLDADPPGSPGDLGCLEYDAC